MVQIAVRAKWLILVQDRFHRMIIPSIIYICMSNYYVMTTPSNFLY